MNKIVVKMKVIIPESVYDEFLTELEKKGEVNVPYSGYQITLNKEEQ